MKFGISTALFEEEKLSERHFSLIKKAGFEFIEIPVGEPHFNPEDRSQVKEIVENLNKHDLRVCSLHTSMKLCTGKYQRKIVEKIEVEFKALQKLGSDIFILHPAELADTDNLIRDEAGRLYPDYSFVRDIEGEGKPFKKIKERLRELGICGKEKGIKIALENMNTCDNKVLTGMVNLLDEVNLDNVGFCLDVGHVNLSQNTEQIIEAFGKRIIHTHLHDNHGDEYDEHLLPFSGTINWRQVLEALQSKGYSGVLLYEVSKKKEVVSAKRMKASLLKMRPLWKEKIESGNDKVKKRSL